MYFGGVQSSACCIPGDDVYLAAAEMKKADAIKAWPDVGRADANPYTREFQVCCAHT